MATPTPITAEFVAHLNEKHGGDFHGEMQGYDVIPAIKFDKIISTRNGRASSVFAFIERGTGKLIKAASYKAPQKDRGGLAYRFDLSTPEGMDEAKNASDKFGSFLYVR